MKILFVWTGVTSYMADCWRELQRKPGVELKIVVEQVASGREFDAPKVLHDLDYVLVDDAGSRAPNLKPQTSNFTPDVIFAVGWHSKTVRKLVTREEWKDVPKICCFDLPWRWKLRCIAAKFVLAPFLRHYDGAYVPGEACARYAKWLGFKKIVKGLFAIDVKRFERVERVEKVERVERVERVEGEEGDRKGFLYVGRNSEEKRVDLIVKAHARYLELGGSWPLDLYGNFPNEPQTSNVKPQAFHPFVQPSEIPKIYAEHACLVLASAFDPWPLVALEAKAAGCKVIQSDRCGNRFELDTRVVRYGDAEALAREMMRTEKAAVGRRSRTRAGRELDFWSCATWAERVVKIVEGIK